MEPDRPRRAARGVAHDEDVAPRPRHHFDDGALAGVRVGGGVADDGVPREIVGGGLSRAGVVARPRLLRGEAQDRRRAREGLRTEPHLLARLGGERQHERRALGVARGGLRQRRQARRERRPDRLWRRGAPRHQRSEGEEGREAGKETCHRNSKGSAGQRGRRAGEIRHASALNATVSPRRTRRGLPGGGAAAWRRTPRRARGPACPRGRGPSARGPRTTAPPSAPAPRRPRRARAPARGDRRPAQRRQRPARAPPPPPPCRRSAAPGPPPASGPREHGAGAAPDHAVEHHRQRHALGPAAAAGEHVGDGVLHEVLWRGRAADVGEGAGVETLRPQEQAWEEGFPVVRGRIGHGRAGKKQA